MSITPSTITATAAVSTATEGTDGVAYYLLSNPLAAATTVQVSLSGWGATTADYSGFYCTITTAGGTSSLSPVAPDGTLTLPTGTLSFTLSTHLTTDALAETGEAVVFVVSQTAASANITNSWWVQSQINIADPAAVPPPPPAPAPAPVPAPAPAPATITAVVPVSTATEGTNGSATFHLSTALAAATTVNASLSGWGATAADYTGFFYTTTVGGVTSSTTAVAANGTVALPAGTTDFTLSTHLATDALAETSESVVFVVSQTAASANIANSWYVTSQVNIADPVAAPPPAPVPPPAPAPAPLTPATITAVNPVATATEGNDATASFHLSTALGAATTVNASLSGWGATGADYAGFFYTTTVGGVTSSPTAVAPDGTIALPTGTTGFTLKTHLATDALAETNESVVFVVSQTAASANIANSWWVQSQVAIADPVVAAPPPSAPSPAPAPITAAAITAANPVTTATEGSDGIALYHLSAALGAATTVKASLSGWGADATDYSGLFYTTTVNGHASGATAVAPDGSIALPVGTTDFTLGTHLTTDTLAESNEAVVFVVSQTAASANISNSWWVQSQVNIADPVVAAPPPSGPSSPAPAPLTPATITASNPVATATEGSAASAAYHLSTALAASTTVNASLSGWGATGADYAGLFYTTTVGGIVSSASAVAPDGTLSLPVGTTDFTLSTHLATDGLSENNEAVVFVVSQTAASTNISNSWWVQSLVNIADAPAVTTFTGGPGSDSFTGTAGPDVFVIPADTSRGILGQFDVISNFGAGDHIALPAGVGSMTVGPDWTSQGEAALIAALQSLSGFAFSGGSGAVIKYVVGGDAYLAVDGNLNGIIEYGSGANQDLFIKIVGGASLAATDLV